MMTLQFIRMLADLSFYGSFAAYIAAHFGGTGSWGGVLLCCAVYALTSRFSKRAVRLVFLLPVLLCGLYRGADLVFLLPCMVYVLWLTWQGDYAPDRDRQRLLFSVFWKLLIFSVPITLFSPHAARTAMLPYAAMMLASSVLLLRALRHEPEVWCHRGYQLMELSLLALTLLAARVLSSPVLLRTVGAVLSRVYKHLVFPVLVVLLRLLVWVLQLVFRLLSLLPGRSGQTAQEVQLDLSGLTLFDGMEAGSGGPAWLLPLLRFALLCAAVVLLFLFFRGLARRRSRAVTLPPVQESRERMAEAPLSLSRERGSVRSIRRQYRHFLRSCDRLGAERQRSSTSGDVEREAGRFPELEDLAEPIRALYLPARYALRGDRNDEETMKRLCTEARRRSMR